MIGTMENPSDFVDGTLARVIDLAQYRRPRTERAQVPALCWVPVLVWVPVVFWARTVA